MEASTWVPALLIVIGMVGIVIPVIPGLLLCVAAVLMIPVVGALVGFVLGIYLVELGHSHDRGAAWQSTRAARRAVMLAMGIELLAAGAIAATWGVGLLLS